MFVLTKTRTYLICHCLFKFHLSYFDKGAILINDTKIPENIPSVAGESVFIQVSNALLNVAKFTYMLHI